MVVQYMYSLASLTDQLTRNGIIAMRDIIKERGHTIPFDDLDKKILKVPIGVDPDSKDVTEHFTPYDYDAYSFAISESDVIIDEASRSNSTTGITIGIALSMGKPCLILVNKPDKREKTARLFLGNLNHPLLTYKEYSSPEELQQIVVEFLESINHRVRVRFNLVMDQNHDNYLTWAASQYDISKTEVITTSITEKSERDEKYQAQRQQFLKRKETKDPECA